MTAAGPGAVLEFRRYRLRPGRREELTALFTGELTEPQEALGMRVIGPYRDPAEPDHFVWLRAFASMPQRAAALAAFYGGPVWARHKDAANATMLNSDNVLLLRPAIPAAQPAAPGASAGPASGWIIATVCSLAPRTEDAFAAYFAAAARPQLVAAGARILGEFVTEDGANTFPRLPVREGETVFVWFAAFPDESAYQEHQAALARSAGWRTEIWPQIDRRLWRRTEISRLIPVAGSRPWR